MGRQASGWTCRQRKEGHAFTVRFTWAGKKYDISTGTRDPELAALEAARIYARVISEVPKPEPAPTAHVQALEGLIEKWLLFLTATHDRKTIITWKGYAEAHFVKHFTGLHDLTDQRVLAYQHQRLKCVLSTTVRKEQTALRSLLGWLYKQGHLPAPVTVPSLGKKVTGTRYEKRRRSPAIELSPAEVRAIIAALPEWSGSKKVERFPVRARFIVAYETSLRPETLDQLRVPEHYAPGRAEIALGFDVDKNRFGREVPLTLAAQRALNSVCPRAGLIFGAHDYRHQLKLAVADALPEHRAKLFAGAHLRSARITHWLENTQNMAGVQYLAGHHRATTTAGYVRASKRAASAVLDDDQKAQLPGPKEPAQLPAYEPRAE